jgi:hypothetical protein
MIEMRVGKNQTVDMAYSEFCQAPYQLTAISLASAVDQKVFVPVGKKKCIAAKAKNPINSIAACCGPMMHPGINMPEN